MDAENAPSPPLSPDTSTGSQQQQQQQFPPQPPQKPQVQPFQEQFVVSAQMQPQQPEPRRASRSRATSSARPIIHQQPQPIRDAVDKAFDQAPTTNQLDPAFIAQVTEAVVKNLQNVNLSQTTQQAQNSSPPTQSAPRSPIQSSTASLPSRYTPPSPRFEKDRQDASSHGTASPERVASDAGSFWGRESIMSERDDDTPKPTSKSSPFGIRRSNTTSDRRRENSVSDDGQPQRRDSRVDSFGNPTERPPRRDSQDSVSSGGYHEGPPRSRVRPPRVPSAVEELTSLEKAWQPLFDNGSPTLRLSQFLRGLALHLIEDFEPKRSLVVTPDKLLRFFDETKVKDEVYPWQIIFGGGMTRSSICTMFRNLRCQLHLVQVQDHEVPSVPGLTPNGFDKFMTCLIQAHPDTEYERLAMAVKHMPISNADDKSERFPKELSRRLFPRESNPQAEQRMIASLAHESNQIQLKNSVAMPPPPPSAPPGSQSSFIERERKPYSQSSFSNTVDDEDLVGPSVPIERERKPYSAREGLGKSYDLDGDRESDRQNTSQYRPDGSNPIPRPTRSNSSQMPPQGNYGPSAPSESRAIPPPNRHRLSMGSGIMQTPGTTNNTNYNRGSGRRSPPSNTPFARSEPSNVGDIPASQYASNLHPQGGFQNDLDDETARRQFGRRPTAPSTVPVDDEYNSRGKPIPSRNPPAQTAYESPYGSAGGPPIGSYGTRPRPVQTNYDDRRRTMYGTGSMSASAGVTDGWGSFANGGHPSQPSHGNSVQH